MRTLLNRRLIDRDALSRNLEGVPKEDWFGILRTSMEGIELGRKIITSSGTPKEVNMTDDFLERVTQRMNKCISDKGRAIHESAVKQLLESIERAFDQIKANEKGMGGKPIVVLNKAKVKKDLERIPEFDRYAVARSLVEATDIMRVIVDPKNGVEDCEIRVKIFVDRLKDRKRLVVSDEAKEALSQIRERMVETLLEFVMVTMQKLDMSEK